MNIVEIENVQVVFGEKTAVSAASFSVAAGETLGVVGESGCGKSTLLRIIAGLETLSRGEILLDGKP
ncbi:MAG TPA: ABC transporter ATP-binding protein, partial [Leclercia adecarboxylata]|nr:ABC transporter ATP-binding protein [Leclercia adecarboxylata]